jgi:RNA polymerase sigma-70 factor (ECF subfamily)
MQPLTSKNAPGRFSRGDIEAGGWIYNEFHPYVFTLVSNMTDPSEDTLDLVHDVFAGLYVGHGRFANRESIRSMLNQIGVRLCINYLKKKEKKSDKTTEFIDDVMPPDDSAIASAESRATMHTLLWQAVGKLPKKKKSFFLLFYKDDLSNEQIAEKLGISVQTAANKKSIILQTLKLEISKMPKSELQEISLILLILLYETL